MSDSKSLKLLKKANTKSHIFFLCPIRDRMYLLPSFLLHYRKLGIEEFNFIDNGSTDGTQQYLIEQDDVNLYFTDQSYSNANCGHDWILELLEYNKDKWCLVVDSDEFFTPPPNLTLNDFIALLDKRNETAVYAYLLDMYSNISFVNDIPLKKNECPSERYHYYDKLTPLSPFNYGLYPFHKSEGLRQRFFGLSACTNKIPLFYYSKATIIKQGLHFIDGNTISKFRCITKHFKYLKNFPKEVEAESQRQEHYDQAREYKRYNQVVNIDNKDILFCPNSSISLKDEKEFLRLGFFKENQVPMASYSLSSTFSNIFEKTRSYFLDKKNAHSRFSEFLNLTIEKMGFSDALHIINGPNHLYHIDKRLIKVLNCHNSNEAFLDTFKLNKPTQKITIIFKLLNVETGELNDVYQIIDFLSQSKHDFQILLDTTDVLHFNKTYFSKSIRVAFGTDHLKNLNYILAFENFDHLEEVNVDKDRPSFLDLTSTVQRINTNCIVASAVRSALHELGLKIPNKKRQSNAFTSVLIPPKDQIVCIDHSRVTTAHLERFLYDLTESHLKDFTRNKKINFKNQLQMLRMLD